MPDNFGEVAPPFACGHLVGLGRACRKEATWHFLFELTEEGWRNGLACDYHKARIIYVRTPFFAVHRYEVVCSMPGAIYLIEENRCVVDEEPMSFEEVIGIAMHRVEPGELVKVRV